MLRPLALLLLATSALITGSAAGPAWAQADATPDTAGTAPKTQAGGLEKIVVTARKREEDQQGGPTSTTALSQADLDKLSVKTIEDLKYVSPSVYIAPTAFRQDTRSEERRVGKECRSR